MSGRGLDVHELILDACRKQPKVLSMALRHRDTAALGSAVPVRLTCICITHRAAQAAIVT